jgi:hypothetical protein
MGFEFFIRSPCCYVLWSLIARELSLHLNQSTTRHVVRLYKVILSTGIGQWRYVGRKGRLDLEVTDRKGVHDVESRIVYGGEGY